MKSFFERKKTQSVHRQDGKALTCVSCGLMMACKSPKMEPYGNFKKGIMIIGEGPGREEDRADKPWQGTSGILLKKALKRFDIDLFEDCISINAVRCLPADKHGTIRTPTGYEMDCCRKYVFEYIKEYKPKTVLLIGNSAIYSVIGKRWKGSIGGIMKWRGWTIPDQDFKTWICPMFHPSYVAREDTKEMKTVWKKDLGAAIAMKDVPFLENKEPEIEIIEDLNILYDIKKQSDPMIAFDYETTGLKPHAPGHRIICVSIADTPDHAYVFMMPKTRDERKPFLDILADKAIRKVAQNMKYEHAWSGQKLRVIVENWFWDTMLATHILDNRPGVTGLKFQAYVQFGVADYASEVTGFFKSAVKSANGINRIQELVSTASGRDDLLKYCGYDSIYEYRLAVLQMEKIIK